MVKFPFYARLAFTLFAIALIISFMYLGRSVLVPLVFFLPGRYPSASGCALFGKEGFPSFSGGDTYITCFYDPGWRTVLFFQSPGSPAHTGSSFSAGKVVAKWNDIQDWISDKYHVSNTQQKDYVNKSANGILNTAMNSVATTFVGIAETVILTIFFFILLFSFFSTGGF